MISPPLTIFIKNLLDKFWSLICVKVYLDLVPDALLLSEIKLQ